MRIFRKLIFKTANRKLICINASGLWRQSKRRMSLQDEMIDRFGNYPKEVEYLFTVAEMKVYARQERVEPD